MKTYERYFGTVEIETDKNYEYACVYDYTMDAIQAMQDEGWKLTGEYYTELTFEREVTE